jgi:hypothetical protein
MHKESARKVVPITIDLRLVFHCKFLGGPELAFRAKMSTVPASVARSKPDIPGGQAMSALPSIADIRADEIDVR